MEIAENIISLTAPFMYSSTDIDTFYFSLHCFGRFNIGTQMMSKTILLSNINLRSQQNIVKGMTLFAV